MIDYKFKPKYLPQISAPYTIIADLLKKNNVGYSLVQMNPNDLIPTQGITISDVVNDVDLEDKNNPMWITKDNEVLDGHHRLVKALKNNIDTVFCFKINDDKLNSCRILNKIQDLYEYENMKNKNLVEFSDDNVFVENEMLSTDKNPIEDMIAYRREPVVENSVIGNFFMLIPVSGYKKYSISFDNVLDIKDLNLNLKTGQSPMIELSRIWFPNYDFSKGGENEKNLRCAAIALKAKKMGYDGIKYSENLIQAL